MAAPPRDPTERVGLRYVPQFVCLAGACKENCCSGLRVELSESNYAHLASRADGTPLEHRVEKLVKLEPPATRSARVHAYIDAGGKSCPFLDPDWLCSIHRTLGEDALADPCSLFPRVLTEVRGRHELSATFACPEAARLCLTTEGAVDLVPLAPDAMAREIVVRRFDAAATDPYVALFEDLRQVCLSVLTADGIRPPVRLLLLADFAAQVGAHFHAGTTTFDLDALRASLDRIPERVPAIAALFEGTPVADVRAVRALEEMLIARLPTCDNGRFHALVRPLVLRDPAAARADVVAYFHGGQAVAVPPEELRARALATHARQAPHLDAAMDEYLRRYAINALVKDWYTQRPTLLSALQRLVVRFALSRFTTLTHPTLDSVRGDEPGALALLADAAVEAFQIVAKNVEHTPSFMDLCESYLGEAGLADTAGLALLLRA